MKIQNKSAFTLIELLVVISILAIMATMSYAGYVTQQQIVRVRLSVKEVSQAIHEARNMAINGYVNNTTDQTNQSIGIYLQKDSNSIKFYGYDYSHTTFPLDDTFLLYERKLQDGVRIGNISGKENIFMVFLAISGEKKFFTFSGMHPTPIDPHPANFLIPVSYKDISVAPFYREVTYFPKTNVVDY